MAGPDPAEYRRPPLPPEECAPATLLDQILFAVSCGSASILTLLLAIPVVRQKVEPPVVMALGWCALIWLVPVLRTVLNWRVAERARLRDRSYLLRIFWQTQLLLSGLGCLVLLSMAVLLRALCIPFPLW